MKSAAVAATLIFVMASGCAPPPTVLTVDNSAELRALLRGPATGEDVEAFTDEHKQDLIRFDGVVVDVNHSAGGSIVGESWINVMAGKASDSEHTGPVFQIRWIDRPGNPAIYDFEKGDNVRVSGGVGALDPYDDVVYILDGEEKGGLTHR